MLSACHVKAYWPCWTPACIYIFSYSGVLCCPPGVPEQERGPLEALGSGRVSTKPITSVIVTSGCRCHLSVLASIHSHPLEHMCLTRHSEYLPLLVDQVWLSCVINIMDQCDPDSLDPLGLQWGKTMKVYCFWSHIHANFYWFIFLINFEAYNLGEM